jgi:hypothetical protein
MRCLVSQSQCDRAVILTIAELPFGASRMMPTAGVIGRSRLVGIRFQT